ncbi:MAG TPA: hypothetical protein VN700_04045 [Vicinamibacterales bacterium]|nr:hypothetical protein [Vicinamibacterales bacterium]
MVRIVPKSYRQNHGAAVLVELASDRPIRSRNKVHYRIAHWPVWIWAFFLAPGPITFSLFAYGASPAIATWFAVVVAGTGIAALFGKLPGTEPRPYVLLYGEDTPNPIHRRICYTVAWGDVVSYASLNAITLFDAAIGGVWHSSQIFSWGYFPIASAVWFLGVAGRLPRARASTQGEGMERRQFYGSLWAVTLAQVTLLALWKSLPLSPQSTWIKLVAFVAVLVGASYLARRGLLPRTRPILPGTRAAAD